MNFTLFNRRDHRSLLLGALAGGLAVSLITSTACRADNAAPATRVDITRDDWASSVGQESEGNNGGASQLKTKGTQEYSLIDIDPKALAGHVIKSVTLHLHCTSPDSPQRRVTVSSVSSDWVAGTGSSYTVQEGSACFNWAEQGKKPWSFPGSDLTSVTNAMGNSIWRFADATPPDSGGWQTVAVAPRVMEARIAGISYGFQIFDDVGSEYDHDGNHFEFHNFLNRFFSSRDANKKFAPYFTVTLGPEDHEAPDAPGAMTVEDTPEPAGEALVSWTTPADHGPAGTIGFVARYVDASGGNENNNASFDWDHATPLPQYLIPMAGKPGENVVMHLRDLKLPPGGSILLGMRAVDAAGNLSKVTTKLVKASAIGPVEIKPLPVQPFSTGGANPTVGGVEVAIVDALDKMEPVTGDLIPKEAAGYLTGNHLWSASEKKIRLFAAKNEFVAFQVLLMGQANGVKVRVHFDGHKDVMPGDMADKYQDQQHPTSDLYRFAYVPVGNEIWPDPLLPMNGPIDIPATDHPVQGQKSAGVIADVYVPHDISAGKHAGTLEVSVGGQTLTIPIELNVWDFTLPDEVSFIAEMNCYGLPNDDLPYYRMAQVNRTTLNRLAYNWRGQVADDHGPKIEDGKYDWTVFDKHYGPIFDGSAFNDLPRKGVPVDTQYLPLCENFPVSVSAFMGGYWADQAFPASYWQQFTEGCRQYGQHFHDKNWTNTLFELYLNDKVYYKKTDWRKCAAPWCFDEPANTQDFWALRQYGVAYHRGVDPVRGDVKMVFRCDISRSQFQRDMLDYVQDVDVVGGSFRQYLRSIMDRKARDGEITLNYGGANPIGSSNFAEVAWAINTWCLGGDGITPWQTIGKAKSWTEADQNSVFYPPLDAAGKATSGDPFASVRLKSFRRGQQDAEYLTILGLAGGYPRFAVAQAVEQAANLQAKLIKKSESDAGLISFDAVTPEQLWALRVRLGATLDAMHPPAKRQWLDLRPPVHNMDTLPEMGYIPAN